MARLWRSRMSDTGSSEAGTSRARWSHHGHGGRGRDDLALCRVRQDAGAAFFRCATHGMAAGNTDGEKRVTTSSILRLTDL